METRQFPCTNCGAELRFAPGTDALQCPYCGTLNEIEHAAEHVEVAVAEQDFKEALARLRAGMETYEVATVKCTNCGAETTFDEHITGEDCPFCGASIVLESATTRLIKPQALLAFKVDDKEARARFGKWLGSLWFAPNDVKQFARREGGLKGVYIPHWTFDARTTTRYQGRRGEYYYTTESYTAMENGKAVQRTRRVRHTRWYPASGTVRNDFDDVLVVASESLPRSYMTKLEPWDLDDVRPYTDAYLSGFRTESYTVDLEAGFSLATQRMQPVIDTSIRRDIGGDTQQILHKNTHYADVTYKHLLLPVWISAYRYRDRVFRFMVNARTGKVTGERPWSKIKIALAILAALILAFIFFYLTQGN